jgi:hypothetical protein
MVPVSVVVPAVVPAVVVPVMPSDRNRDQTAERD